MTDRFAILPISSQYLDNSVDTAGRLEAKYILPGDTNRFQFNFNNQTRLVGNYATDSAESISIL